MSAVMYSQPEARVIHPPPTSAVGRTRWWQRRSASHNQEIYESDLTLFPSYAMLGLSFACVFKSWYTVCAVANHLGCVALAAAAGCIEARQLERGGEMPGMTAYPAACANVVFDFHPCEYWRCRTVSDIGDGGDWI